MLYLLLYILLAGNPVEINNAWIRPAAKDANTAMYCEIINNGSTADTLFNVTSNIARRTEIHETFKSGEMMGMRRVQTIVVKPKEKIYLQPGGMHIMLIGTESEVKKGEQGEVSFHFKRAGIIKVKGVVKSN
jgi:copper(I)-binding protein